MGQVVYGKPSIPLDIRVRHLCVHGCRRVPVDPETGHTIGWWCQRPTPESGLRKCDICERDYIDPNKHQDSKYETNCPSCVVRYDLDE